MDVKPCHAWWSVAIELDKKTSTTNAPFISSVPFGFNTHATVGRELKICAVSCLLRANVLLAGVAAKIADFGLAQPGPHPWLFWNRPVQCHLWLLAKADGQRHLDLQRVRQPTLRGARCPRSHSSSPGTGARSQLGLHTYPFPSLKLDGTCSLKMELVIQVFGANLLCFRRLLSL